MTASKETAAPAEAANDASAKADDAAAATTSAPATTETGADATTTAEAAPPATKKSSARLPTRKPANGEKPSKPVNGAASKSKVNGAHADTGTVASHDSSAIDARLHAQRHLQLLGASHALCGVTPEAAGDKATFQFVLSEAARQTHLAPDHRNRFCLACIVELGAMTAAIPEPGGFQPPPPYQPDLEEPGIDDIAPIESAIAAAPPADMPIVAEPAPSPPGWIAMLPTGAVAIAFGVDRAAAAASLRPLGYEVTEDALLPAAAGEAMVLVFDHGWRGEISERTPFIVPHVSDVFAKRCAEHLERLAVDADLADFTFDVTQPPPRPIAAAHTNGAVQ